MAPLAADAEVDDALDVDPGREPGHQREHIEQIARAGVEDVVARDHRDDARCLARGLRLARRDVDLGVEQIGERELLDVGDALELGRLAGGRFVLGAIRGGRAARAERADRACGEHDQRRPGDHGACPHSWRATVRA